jgi:hypothetical protein
VIENGDRIAGAVARVARGVRMMLREIWGRLVATNYTRALEREVARLRAENRALLNSILGIAGVPPIVVPLDDVVAPMVVEPVTEKRAPDHGTAPKNKSGAGKGATVQGASGLSVKHVGRGTTFDRGMKTVATPMRRRSWHQIYRMLEIDAARKKEAV